MEDNVLGQHEKKPIHINCTQYKHTSEYVWWWKTVIEQLRELKENKLINGGVVALMLHWPCLQIEKHTYFGSSKKHQR